MTKKKLQKIAQLLGTLVLEMRQHCKPKSQKVTHEAQVSCAKLM